MVVGEICKIKWNVHEEKRVSANEEDKGVGGVYSERKENIKMKGNE